MLRATLISNAGEALYFRGDGTGYFFVANNGGTTFLYYFQISGSVLTLLGSITGAAANDVFNVVAQGPFITVVRNNRVVLEASSLLNINSKEHGIRNALGAGAVLVDDFCWSRQCSKPERSIQLGRDGCKLKKGPRVGLLPSVAQHRHRQ
jgi:hypothetical protein